MEQVQNRYNYSTLYSTQQTENDTNILTQYLGLRNCINDPLGESEVTVNLNEVFVSWTFQSLDDLGEAIVTDDNDSIIQDNNIDSEEQVVPSSQISNGTKDPEETIIPDNELTNGNFENNIMPYTITLAIDNNMYNSQPP